MEIVEINLYGPGDAASVMEEGRIAALGHAPVKLPKGESITVDFGYVRSPLGAFIEWGADLRNRLLGVSLRRRQELSRGWPHH